MLSAAVACTSNNQWNSKPVGGPGVLPPRLANGKENAVGFLNKANQKRKKNAELFGGL